MIGEGFPTIGSQVAPVQASIAELIKASHDSQVPRYVIVEGANLDWVHFETPNSKDREYAVFGDPGILGPPHRNTPVLSIWDVSNPKTAARLVDFWWSNGGRIEPFVDKLVYFIQKYHPSVAGIDSTAIQKYLAEILTTNRIAGVGFSVESITGMDFSWAKKMGYFAALRIAMENKKMLGHPPC